MDKVISSVRELSKNEIISCINDLYDEICETKNHTDKLEQLFDLYIKKKGGRLKKNIIKKQEPVMCTDERKERKNSVCDSEDLYVSRQDVGIEDDVENDVREIDSTSVCTREDQCDKISEKGSEKCKEKKSVKQKEDVRLCDFIDDKGMICGKRVPLGENYCSKHTISGCCFINGRKKCGNKISLDSLTGKSCRLHLIQEFSIDTSKFIIHTNKHGNMEHKYTGIIFIENKATGVQIADGNVCELTDEDLLCVKAYKLPLDVKYHPRMRDLLSSLQQPQSILPSQSLHPVVKSDVKITIAKLKELASNASLKIPSKTTRKNDIIEFLLKSGLKIG
jgi:hypothetical protein